VTSHYLNEDKWFGADPAGRIVLLQDGLKAEVALRAIAQVTGTKRPFAIAIQVTLFTTPRSSN
jgi:hypothetical protein